MSTPPFNPSALVMECGQNRLIRARHGYMLYNKNDTVVGRLLEAYGEYLEAEVDIFRMALRPGDVAVDVGANIGAHTLAMARLVAHYGRVHAFEAQRSIHQMLCANMALNCLDHVECTHAAVGDREGLVGLADLRLDVPQNFGGAELAALPGPHKTRLITLDSWLSVPRLRLMKVDVEGMELDVLRGAAHLIKEHRPALYIENDRPRNSAALIDHVKSIGYRAYWHLPSDFNPNNFFANPTPIGERGFINAGEEFLRTNGLAINVFCIPAEAGAAVQGLREVVDTNEHPMKPEHNALFSTEQS